MPGLNFSSVLQIRKVPSLVINSKILHDIPQLHFCTLKLLPEVERLLDSEHIKHRKHPGVRKMPPIKLPVILAENALTIISDSDEKKVYDQAEALKKFLKFRRLPLEKEELNMRYNHTMAIMNDEPDETGVITDAQFDKMRKTLRVELMRWQPMEFDRLQCLSYMALRLAPNYASVFKVFSEIKSCLPDFQPKTFFDFGSGVGSCLWAAHSNWDKTIEEYFCVDSSPDMNDLAQDLLIDSSSGEAVVNKINFRQFLPASNHLKYDLVVSAFSLLEMPSAKDRIKVIDILWRKTNDILVLIETGNVAGFCSVLDARDYVLHIENNLPESLNESSGAHVLMPCPHELSCPMLSQKKTCGVFVSYESTFPKHRTIYKKDWISYVVLRKGKRSKDVNDWPRIVQSVLKKSGFVICRACCPDGNLKEFKVTKHRHGRHAYRCVKSSKLGDLLPCTVETSESELDIEPSLQGSVAKSK